MKKEELKIKVLAKVKKAFLNDKIKAEVNKLAILLKKVEAEELPKLLNNLFNELNLSLEQKNEVVTVFVVRYRIPLVSEEHKKVLKKFIKDNKLIVDAQY